MAKSPAHKWGPIIGDLFEEGIRERLQEFADQKGLYLDYKRKRPARSGVKVTWGDRYGNKHDLDYVLEEGGTEHVIGSPKAFIEVA